MMRSDLRQISFSWRALTNNQQREHTFALVPETG
jgi:hypothetical protein